ncbi:MAG: ferritin-like domain-containing protein [Planctomycetota bacterium]|nr:ferritin-like domain-containing protein [Planctomycetota bacterium]
MTQGISRKEAIDRLNGLLSEEMEASMRYLHLGMMVQGLDRLIVQKVLQENLEETLEHSEQVAEKILQLGGCPAPKIRVEFEEKRYSGKEALQEALLFEQAALDGYRDLLEHVDGGGDVILEEFARQQVSVESEHVAGLKMLLEE